MKSLITFRLILALYAVAWMSDAATITWTSQPLVNTGSNKEIMPTGQLDLSGDFVYAQNVGGVALEYQMMDFAADSGLLAGTAAGIHSAYHNNTNVNPISSIGWWNNDGPVTITLGAGAGEVGGALVTGRRYRVQLLLMNGINGYNQTAVVDGRKMGRFSYGVTPYWGDGMVVAGTFTADGASQSFEIQNYNPSDVFNNASLNALILHENVVETVAQWNLGESGSIDSSNHPQDSTGVNHFTSGGGLVVTNTADTRSNASLHFDGSSYGAYATTGSGLPTDNVGIEMWLRTTNTLQNTDAIFQTDQYADRLKFHVTNGNWGVSVEGNWIGGTSGSGQPVSSGDWTHIAIIRKNGVSTFYFNGVANAGTQTYAFVTSSNLHLGIAPFATSRFNGDIDQIRVFTFVPDTVDPVRALLINHVTEPPPGPPSRTVILIK